MMPDWIEEALKELDETEHNWIKKGNGSMGYYALYCPEKEEPMGFGSSRAFNYCPHCGEKVTL